MRSLRSRWFEAIPSCAVLASQEFTAFLWQFSPQICFIDVKTQFFGGIIIQQISTAPCAPAKSLVFTWKTYLVILVLVVCTAGIHPPCSNSSFSAKHEKKNPMTVSVKKKAGFSTFFISIYIFLCKNTIWCRPLFPSQPVCGHFEHELELQSAGLTVISSGYSSKAPNTRGHKGNQTLLFFSW